MNEVEVEALLNQRKYIKGRITNVGKLIATTQPESLKDLENRLTLLFQQYEEVQAKLITVDLQKYEADSDIVETKYFDLLGKIQSSIKALPITANPADSRDIDSILQSPHDISSSVRLRDHCLKLPKIELPKFDGSFQQWDSFKDLFVTLVHQNSDIPDIQKLMYLKSCLKNEAANIVKNLDSTGENYGTTWDTLLKRYDNITLKANFHLKCLFELKKITKPSAELKTLLSKFNQHLNSLKSLSEEKLTDIILIYVLAQKLDVDSLQQYELQRDQSKMPALAEFIGYLEHRSAALEVLPKTESVKPIKNNRGHTYASLGGSKKQISCYVCKEGHWVTKCPKFKNMDVKQRQELVDQKKLCISCLGENHNLEGCKYKKFGCKKCEKPHHYLLHREQATKTGNEQSNVESTLVTGITNTACATETKYILMSTVLVYITDHRGIKHHCRVLLDNASDRNYVSQNFVSEINVPLEPCAWEVGGIGGKMTQVKGSVVLELESRVSDYKLKARFGLIEKITEPMPHISFPKSAITWPRYADLADPNFNERSSIDMLLGVEGYCEMILKGKIVLPTNSGRLILQNTHFGWVFSGAWSSNNELEMQTKNTTLLSQHNDLNETLSNFWRLEEVSQQSPLSAEEKLCEKMFSESVTRNDAGRYEVDLPIKSERLKLLGESYSRALSCLLSLERRLGKNPRQYDEYRKFIREFLELGHAHWVDITPEVGYYMPHHAVLKADSSTTKLRVVFNASAKTSTGVSLNDTMLVGPVVQSDLVSVILRFRKFQYAITADITKMYRQINIKPKYQLFQRILWRDKPSDNIRCLQLSTVTYGTASASFLATRTLLKLVEDEGKAYPLASYAIEENSYVDDILTGADSFDEAKCLQDELIVLLSKGCFELHKWCSNNETLLSVIPSEKRELGNVHLSGNPEAIKTLGLIWEPFTDMFRISLSPEDLIPGKTKREILSCIAKIFDPIGLVAPVTVYAKIIMQTIWKQNLKWDEVVPNAILSVWSTFVEKLRVLAKINIPRCIFGQHIVDLQIHGFSDASTKAYGACLYICIVKSNGTLACNLLCSKSKVAPLKPISLPRLELCAALLLSRLLAKVKLIYKPLTLDTFLWSDSTITLCWIKSDAARWNVFVANRVSEIQELTSTQHWRHVVSADNPADLVSRGVEPEVLKESDIWWHGPEWLRLPNHLWPHQSSYEVSEDIPERRKVALSCTKIEVAESALTKEFKKHSKFSRLRRVFAYVLRFINNIRGKGINKLSGVLSSVELQASVELIIKAIQAVHFSKEIDQLSNLKLNPGFIERFSLKGSRLKFLNPFLDEKGILRVGGRLKHATISPQQKYPMILPPKDYVTKLILIAEHEKLLHAGCQLVLANIRLKFWPINGKSEIKSIIHNCVKCFRFKAEAASQLMADLPMVRVTPSRPFLYCGIDFAGPFNIKQSRLRKSLVTKGYICLFVCMASKALHLETVPDLSTKAFLNALNRFTSRRGKCQKIFSDNATNFKGAYNELKELYKMLNTKCSKELIQDKLAENSIQWEFIPPVSPHWGGIWESGVKSVKFHLRRTLRDCLFTYEEFNTIIIQIEGILNSRPLCELSSDPEELTALTPAHFLIGDTLTAYPDLELENIPVNRLSLYQQISKLKQVFWKRWSIEYLSSLQIRKKWETVNPNMQEGALVLVKEDNIPPQKWCLARIVKLFPGKDNCVRAVLIRTSTGEYARPITKICPLPNP